MRGVLTGCRGCPAKRPHIQASFLSKALTKASRTKAHARCRSRMGLCYIEERLTQDAVPEGVQCRNSEPIWFDAVGLKRCYELGLEGLDGRVVECGG